MKKDILKDLLAKPGKKQLVSDFDSSFTGDLSKQDAKEQLAKDIEKLSELQSMLYAQDRYSILIIFQAMDAAGKDGTIKHVMSGINPQGCQATFCRGIGPRLSLAYQSLSPGKRTNRHFQPFALRRCADCQSASGNYSIQQVTRCRNHK